MNNDLELIAKIRSGDRDAYAELVRKHHAAVLGLCLSMLGSRSQAEDAAQDVFIKAYRSLDKFREDSSFSTWLYRIASNHCLDLLRQRSREKTDSLEALLDREGDHAQRLFFTEPTTALAPEDADLIERMLSRLPPEYRLILTLREVQGLNYKELTEALDCSLDAVKARLKRARRSLEEMGRHILESDSV
jgi:RNA polymerase sigma-70 factor (ECF subfamily)